MRRRRRRKKRKGRKRKRRKNCSTEGVRTEQKWKREHQKAEGTSLCNYID